MSQVLILNNCRHYSDKNRNKSLYSKYIKWVPQKKKYIYIKWEKMSMKPPHTTRLLEHEIFPHIVQVQARDKPNLKTEFHRIGWCSKMKLNEQL
jgi:hypothetical protein